MASRRNACSSSLHALSFLARNGKNQDFRWKLISSSFILVIVRFSRCRPERDTEEGDVVTFEMPELRKIAKAHNCHPALICMKWAVQRGHVPIPFSIYENEYVGNLRTVTEDFLTEEEMETLRKADRNARLIKGKVFLWESAKDWRDIWDGEDEENN